MKFSRAFIEVCGKSALSDGQVVSLFARQYADEDKFNKALAAIKSNGSEPYLHQSDGDTITDVCVVASVVETERIAL